MEDLSEKGTPQPEDQNQAEETKAENSDQTAQETSTQPEAVEQQSISEAQESNPATTPAEVTEEAAPTEPTDEEQGAKEVTPEQAEQPRPTAPVEAPVAPVETPVAPVETPVAPVEAPVAQAEEIAPTEPRKPEAPRRPAPKPVGPRLASLRPGMIVEGTVTRIERYGAFVDLGLAERRDGLIHISELAAFRIRRVEDVVQLGSAVRARVVSVDMEKGRIALSLNDTEEQVSGASVGPNEPALSAMALAFQEAQNRKQDRDDKGPSEGGEAGERKKREQEELMRKLGSSGA